MKRGSLTKRCAEGLSWSSRTREGRQTGRDSDRKMTFMRSRSSEGRDEILGVPVLHIGVNDTLRHGPRPICWIYDLTLVSRTRVIAHVWTTPFFFTKKGHCSHGRILTATIIVVIKENDCSLDHFTVVRGAWIIANGVSVRRILYTDDRCHIFRTEDANFMTKMESGGIKWIGSCTIEYPACTP